MKITVLGSGGWGTALSLLLLDNGNDVTLWSFLEKEAEALRETRENPMLKGVPPHVNDGCTRLFCCEPDPRNELFVRIPGILLSTVGCTHDFWLIKVYGDVYVALFRCPIGDGRAEKHNLSHDALMTIRKVFDNIVNLIPLNGIYLVNVRREVPRRH